MTVLRTAPGPSEMRPAAGLGGPPPPPPRRPRNLIGAVLGLLLIVFCATAVAVYAANAGHRRGVLVVSHAVGAGHAITANDIGEARVAADPSVHAVLASQRDVVVGRLAAVDLVPGTLLTPADLASGPVVPSGAAVVGLNVKLGYAPTGLRTADRVELVLTAPAADSTQGSTPSSAAPATGAGGSVLVSEARVYDVSPTPDGQGQIVSVIVDSNSAPVVAAAGARGEVSVLLLGGAR